MSARPQGSEAVADALRAHPPALDDLAKARMERQIVARERPGARSPSRRTWVIGGALAVAAAAGLVVALRSPAAEAPVARFEVRDVEAVGQRGTLEAGSAISTGPAEVAEVRVADSEVRLEPNGRLRIATMTDDRLTLELAEGQVRVGFHPRRRGRERLSVITPHARVEVVGTVFTVRAREGATRVSVTEGAVRVVPLGAGAPREVRAGESMRVAGDDEAVAGAGESTGVAGDDETAAGEPGPREDPPAPNDGASASVPAPGVAAEGGRERSARGLLAEARRELRAGRADRAEPLLRRLVEGAGPASLRVEGWTLLGDLTQRSGRFDRAVTAYERAATLGDGTMAGANAIYALARLQDRRLGDGAAARRSYDRYLQATPDGPLSDQARAALCRLGDAERCSDEAR